VAGKANDAHPGQVFCEGEPAGELQAVSDFAGYNRGSRAGLGTQPGIVLP